MHTSQAHSQAHSSAQVIQLFDPQSSTYTYLVYDPHSLDAVIIDPVDDQIQRDQQLIQDKGLKVRWALETHAHADHITSAGLLAEHLGLKTAAPEGCHIGTASVQLVDGQLIPFGAFALKALHTPGHTAGSMSFYVAAQEGGHVFTGDTLLIGGCGRTDFQSGSAQALYHSITQILFKLPQDTTVWPGHDYKGQTHSSIGDEIKHNVRVAGHTEAQFVAIMNNLNLPKPRRIDEAVPANLNSGLRQDAGGETVKNDVLTIRHADGYAGDVYPELAWHWVQSGEAVLVDVRSDAERAWVGFVPEAKPLAWKQWPVVDVNPEFDAGIRAIASTGLKIVLLCRSGVRSVAAAQRASTLGIEAFNILEGFEGDPDANAHRGKLGGWRMRGLPWRQN
jgi:glyoxylase-like metal-dependent hydrolase (beta-lactamase superfamily II)/rhodanese-related sulfurtransferase